MIWSLGPDRNMRRTPSHGWAFDAAGTESTAADQGINRDNILSWQ
jgi:hypothetical protein